MTPRPSAEFVGALSPSVRGWLVAAVPLSLLLALSVEAWVAVAGALAQGLRFVWVDLAKQVAAAVVTVAPALTIVAIVFVASRRSARAAITPDHVWIRPLHLPWPVFTIPLVDVVARRTTAHGVILDAPAAVPRALAWLLAPLVPASMPEELARVHAALDAPHVGAATIAAPAGRVVDRRELFALLLVVLVWAVSSEGLRPVIGGAATLSFHGLGAALLLVLGALALPSRVRVHLGAETVSAGGLCVAWNEVTRLAASGPWFTLEAGRRRRAARLSRRDIARLFAVARERLTRDGRVSVVEAASSPWVRRRGVALGASTVVFAFLAAVVGPLRYRTIEGVVQFRARGEHGPSALLVFRKHDLAPQLVVIVEGEPDRSKRGACLSFPRAVTWSSTWSSSPPDGSSRADVDVDVRRGLVRVLEREHPIPAGATVVHVRPGSVIASVHPLGQASPALRGLVGDGSRADLSDLAGSFARPADPILLGALDGRTSTRCFDVGTWDDGLVAKVDRGRVLSVAVVSGKRPCFRCLPCALATEPRLADGNGRTQTEATLPTFAEVRQALAAIEGGASVASATARWPRPAGVSRER